MSGEDIREELKRRKGTNTHANARAVLGSSRSHRWSARPSRTVLSNIERLSHEHPDLDLHDDFREIFRFAAARFLPVVIMTL